MAKNIEFMGAVFPDVPSIRLPQYEGGLVSFDDTTDANATAEDIAQGKIAYVNGEKVIGTASGGGGIAPLFDEVLSATTAQSNVTLREFYAPISVLENKSLIYSAIDEAGKRNNYYFGSAGGLMYKTDGTAVTGSAFGVSVYCKTDGSLAAFSRGGQNPYGIYITGVSTTTIDGVPMKLMAVKCSYNANNTKTIDGNYRVVIFAI